MKNSKLTLRLTQISLRTLVALALGAVTFNAPAAVRVWNGGGADAYWSTPANWDSGAPIAFGDQLTFAGSTGLINTNDGVLGLVNGSSTTNGSITFAAGAGSFSLHILSGFETNQIEWSDAANGQFIANNSGVDQTINMGWKDVTGGSYDRSINAGGATITFNLPIHFGNDRLFPNGTAGTIVLNGDNTGDGTGNAINGGLNKFRSTVRNNAENTQMILGSDTALGNAGTGTIEGTNAVLKGLVANAQTYIATSSNLDCSGSTLVVNTAKLNLNSTNDVTFAYVGNQGGNRDFRLTTDATVTLVGGMFFSEGTTARQLNTDLTGAGGNLVVNGKLYPTLHSDGISTLKQSGATGDTNYMVTATARFQNGVVTLNGDSSLTFTNGEVRANGSACTLVLGHDNAMGDSSSYVDIDGGSILDLNGHTISQTFIGLGDNAQIINSDTNNPAGITSQLHGQTGITIGSFSVGGAGDVELQDVFVDASVNRNLTKEGTGTLTLSGSTNNTRYGLIVNGGTVLLNKTSAYAVVNNPLVINSGLVKITGTGGNQINNADSLQVDGGVFDLNGFNEAVGGLDAAAAGGVVLNSAAGTTNTLYIGGSSGGSASGDYAGLLQDGAGVLALTKEGSGTNVLRGANTYSGDTTIKDGVLSITTAYLDDLSSVVFDSNSGANHPVLDLDFAGTDTVDALYFDGVQQASGTWGASGSGATHINDTLFSGTGTLTVTTGPAGAPKLEWMSLGGGVVQFTVPSGYKLIYQTNGLNVGLSTNWMPWLDTNSPVNVTNDPTIPTRFFGLGL